VISTRFKVSGGYGGEETVKRVLRSRGLPYKSRRAMTRQQQVSNKGVSDQTTFSPEGNSSSPILLDMKPVGSVLLLCVKLHTH
jgi:hypothetical protein